MYWGQFSIFAAGEALTLALPMYFVPKFRGQSLPDTVRPVFKCSYWGAVAILQAVLFGVIGVIQKGPWTYSDIVSWAVLVGGFLMSGTALLTWASKAKIVIADRGLTRIYVFRQPVIVSWDKISRIRSSLLRQAIIVEAKGAATLSISNECENLDILQAEAARRGIRVD